MSNKSGAYVIDSEYNIVSFNDAAKAIYAQLQVGAKCHKCLMGLDEPCPPCPVFNKVEGPQTYLDPIRKIRETVDAVEIPLGDGSVGHALVFSTVGESEEVSRQLPKTEEELNRLFEEGYVDGLTNGPNRQGFTREARRFFDEAAQDDQFLLLVCDIRNFKAFNELFGTRGGDKLLCDVYERIVNAEFAPLVTSRIEADHIACLLHRSSLDLKTFKSELEFEWTLDGRTVQVYCKCGIYYVDDMSMPVSKMLDRANIAKDSIVEGHLAAYSIYDESIQTLYLDQATILADFKQALNSGDIQVWYQPIVDAKTYSIVAAEALARWDHPQYGPVSPSQFVPVLERFGMISRLDKHVADKVCDYLTGCIETGRPYVPVSVNLSWADFYDDTLVNAIADHIEGQTPPVGAVNFELTETSLVSLEQNRHDLLEKFRECHVKLLLDDFGSGYSSFSMIRDYDFDVVKLDRSFTSKIETSPKVRDILRGLIVTCHQVGLKVLAEGVESKLEADFLRDNGCDLLQGFHFCKPVTQDQFSRLVQDRLAGLSDGPSSSTSLLEEELKELIEGEGRGILAERDPGFLGMLLDNSDVFIQVCRPEDHTMVYANGVTRSISQRPDTSYVGARCYEYMSSLSAPCAHCPMNQMEGLTEKQIEVDDGSYVFSLTAKFFEWKGQRLFAEFGRDVTQDRRRQQRYDSQIASILKSIPDGQGVFHVDVTENLWLSSSGNAQNARDMQDLPDVDALVRKIASFVPDEEGQERFFNTFCRDALLRAYEQERFEISLETLSYYDDMSIRWSRITARLVLNPQTQRVEAVIYGTDISKEHQRQQELEDELRKLKQESKEQLRHAVEEYNEADHDRRTDFLTGLGNRLDLCDCIKTSLGGTSPDIVAMYMLDLDNFKVVNDSYGHCAGDECLRIVGNALSELSKTRKVVFFRYGGEEFLGVGFDPKVSPEVFAEDLVKLVPSLDMEFEGQHIGGITASVGYTCDNRRYEKMIDLADRAMYEAKHRGKNQAVSSEDQA